MKWKYLKYDPPKTYMGMWQVLALSSVLKIPVFSIYPNKGNPSVRADLNRMVYPRLNREEDDRVASIMWTTTRLDMNDQNWIPNHFVPVLKQSPDIEVALECEMFDLDDQDDSFDVGNIISMLDSVSDDQSVDAKTSSQQIDDNPLMQRHPHNQ
ncbi:hypothetical protein KUTeg_022437 [Tegillarca granosa]|uniref:Uncharacterized protein n=1 Tax=Tegillarca granosa TaxID=220873 RepID=A0ABQ9E685_TEGGR|nr:hypothetical protein KUTeg_022437 [Tegillarca granosa]